MPYFFHQDTLEELANVLLAKEPFKLGLLQEDFDLDWDLELNFLHSIEADYSGYARKTLDNGVLTADQSVNKCRIAYPLQTFAPDQSLDPTQPIYGYYAWSEADDSLVLVFKYNAPLTLLNPLTFIEIEPVWLDGTLPNT